MREDLELNADKGSGNVLLLGTRSGRGYLNQLYNNFINKK